MAEYLADSRSGAGRSGEGGGAAGSRRLVVCLDGTNDALGLSRPTNPAKVFEMLDLDHPAEQLAYYDPGVGTLPASTARGALERRVSIGAQLAFGFGMRTNVTQAYTWLMTTYRPGDRIYVFGFSRGAFTARALVSMLASPGLLRSGSDNLVEYAVKEYASGPALRSGSRAQYAMEFADSFCWGTEKDPMNPAGSQSGGMRLTPEQTVHAVPVEYVGIWDTVFAGFRNVDWPGIAELPNVRRLRHAVSIDEWRRPYREVLVETEGRDQFEEVWFAGVHSDVGGTFPKCQLAIVALKWVFDAVCGELGLRDGQPDIVYRKYCTVHQDYASSPVNVNSDSWKILGTRRRPIPGRAVLHSTVRERRQSDPGYLPGLPHADSPSRWTDSGWMTPAQFV